MNNDDLNQTRWIEQTVATFKRNIMLMVEEQQLPKVKSFEEFKAKVSDPYIYGGFTIGRLWDENVFRVYKKVDEWLQKEAPW